MPSRRSFDLKKSDPRSTLVRSAFTRVRSARSQLLPKHSRTCCVGSQSRCCHRQRDATDEVCNDAVFARAHRSRDRACAHAAGVEPASRIHQRPPSRRGQCDRVLIFGAGGIHRAFATLDFEPRDGCPFAAPTVPCSRFALRASCLPQTSCSAACPLVLGLRPARELARVRLRGELGKALASPSTWARSSSLRALKPSRAASDWGC